MKNLFVFFVLLPMFAMGQSFEVFVPNTQTHYKIPSGLNNGTTIDIIRENGNPLMMSKIDEAKTGTFLWSSTTTSTDDFNISFADTAFLWLAGNYDVIYDKLSGGSLVLSLLLKFQINLPSEFYVDDGGGAWIDINNNFEGVQWIKYGDTVPFDGGRPKYLLPGKYIVRARDAGRYWSTDTFEVIGGEGYVPLEPITQAGVVSSTHTIAVAGDMVSLVYNMPTHTTNFSATVNTTFGGLTNFTQNDSVLSLVVPNNYFGQIEFNFVPSNYLGNGPSSTYVLTVLPKGYFGQDTIDILNQHIVVLEDTLATKTAELENANTALASKTIELENANTALATKTAELDNANTALATKTAELENANTALVAKTAELENANTALVAKTLELENANTALASKTTELDQLTEKFNNLDSAFKNATSTFTNLVLEIQELQSLVLDLEQQLQTCLDSKTVGVGARVALC